MTLRAAGDDKMFVCVCGFREKLSAFEKKKKAMGNKGSKTDFAEYQKKQAALEAKKDAENNPFAKALAGLKLDK
jgi:DNA topoisomerase-3